MMTTNAQINAVVKEIQVAFTSMRYPGDDKIGHDPTGYNLEAQLVARHFRGKRWQDVDWTVVKAYREFADVSACLAFMTPAAFRYYLPAFLLIVIFHYEEADLIVDTTISNLTPWPNETEANMVKRTRERHSGFTAAQRAAIKSFLRLIRQEHADDDFFVEDVDRALQYWEGRRD